MNTSLPDLSHCASEPIHIPGAIQPHGCLIAFDPASLVVLNASANLAEFLATPARTITGSAIEDALPPSAMSWLRGALAGAPGDREPFRWAEGEQPRVATLHLHDGVGLLEIERDDAPPGPPLARGVQSALARLSRVASIETLVDETVQIVRELAGFERTMVYRFDEDDHGEVIAESKPAQLEPYLGLHYPESDIPRQARALYRRYWLRAIPDARYSPVPLVPAVRPDTGRPLDLSPCTLRSVSPVHLEYLANMGVRASMSVSLVVDDRLWGLIAAIDRRPRQVPPEVRSACESIGRLVSLHIAALAATGLERERAAKAETIGQLVEAMQRTSTDVLLGLSHAPEALTGVVGAAAAAIVVDGEVRTIGDCPEPDALLRLAQVLRERADASGLFHCHSILESLGCEVCAARASGLLAIFLPTPALRGVLWLRPEVVQTVNWGGNPDKAVERRSDEPVPRLHPRRSFALWQQTLRGRSLRWSVGERRAAADLRRFALELDLAARFGKEQEAVRARDELVAVVSHDLRTPMSVIVMQAFLIQRLLNEGEADLSQRIASSAETIRNAGERMSRLLNDLTDLTQIEAGRFQIAARPQSVARMLADVCSLLQPLAAMRGIRLVRAPVTDITVKADAERIFQVLSNLVGNAIKFSPDGADIELGAVAHDGVCEISVRDHGRGIRAEDLPRVFDRYWHGGQPGSRGSGLGLYIARGIVRAHGGEIRVDSSVGTGSTFAFTLPLDQEADIGVGAAR